MLGIDRWISHVSGFDVHVGCTWAHCNVYVGCIQSLIKKKKKKKQEKSRKEKKMK